MDINATTALSANKPSRKALTRFTTIGMSVQRNEIEHYMGKDQTQRLERTNGIVRQQTGRWHRRQNKFGKVWEQTKVTTWLVVSYFN